MGSVNSCFCNKESNNVALSDTGAEDRNNNMEDEEPSMGSALNLHQSQIEEHPVPHPNFIIQLLLEDVNPPLSSILPSHLRTGDGPSTPIPLRRVTFQPAPHRPSTSHPASHFRPERVSTVLDLRRLRPTNRVPGFNWSPRPSPLASPTYDTLEQGDLTSVQVDLPGVRNLEDDAFDLPWQLNPEDEDVELTHSPVAGDEATPEDTGVGDVACSLEATPEDAGVGDVACSLEATPEDAEVGDVACSLEATPEDAEVGDVKCSVEATPEDAGVGDVKCPVCLDGIAIIKSSGRSVMSTVCGHIFCSSCLPACIRANHSCPTCRMTIWEFDIHPIFI